MDSSIEVQFHEKTLEVYENAKVLCGYSARRFLQKIKRDGGIKAAKAWLNPKNINKPPTSGFLRLVENNLLRISLEALVLKEPWQKLFSNEELNVAKKRLMQFGYNPELDDQNSTSLIPEELSDHETFFEGAKCTITVNSFERNSIAREKCIEHYGSSCVICNFNFEKVYGSDFKNFIHIHHLRPLASIAQNYELNPIDDLRPVCPNCHAIIHKRNPPYTISEIKLRFIYPIETK